MSSKWQVKLIMLVYYKLCNFAIFVVSEANVTALFVDRNWLRCNRPVKNFETVVHVHIEFNILTIIRVVN